MDKFEYGVVTLDFEHQEMEIDEAHKQNYLAYSRSKKYGDEYVDKIKRYIWKEVVVAIRYDSTGIEHEIMRFYTGNDHTTAEYVDGTILLSSLSELNDVWSHNYPIGIIAKRCSILGQDGWEVIEYKFNTTGSPFSPFSRNHYGFAQAFLKKRIQEKE